MLQMIFKTAKGTIRWWMESPRDTFCLGAHHGGIDQETGIPGPYVCIAVLIHMLKQVIGYTLTTEPLDIEIGIWQLGFLVKWLSNWTERREWGSVLNPGRVTGLAVCTHSLLRIRQHDVPTCDGKSQAPHRAGGLREFCSLTHWSWNRKSSGLPSAWWMGPGSTFWLWKQIYPGERKGGNW